MVISKFWTKKLQDMPGKSCVRNQGCNTELKKIEVTLKVLQWYNMGQCAHWREE